MSGMPVVVPSDRRDGGRAVRFPAQCGFSEWLICGVQVHDRARIFPPDEQEHRGDPNVYAAD
jgi:hypothetical protein